MLTLNKNWTPIDTVRVSEAFGRLFAGTVQFLNTDDYTLHGVDSWLDLPVTDQNYAIRTSRLAIRVPEVQVLREHARVPERRVMQFGRRNIMKRDRATCQYCGARPGIGGLTIDHINPRAKGGKSSWLNCVLACPKCQDIKGSKTLEQSGLKLRVRPEIRLTRPNEPHLWTRPYEPAWTPIFHVSPAHFKESWRKFLPEKAIETVMTG